MNKAFEEVKCGAFKDPRLDRRLVKLVEELCSRPDGSPAEMFEDSASLVAAYRFWDNPRVSPRRILVGHVEQTVRRAFKYPTVLAIQDTTEINVTHRQSVKGVGYLASRHSRGLLMHSVFAVSPSGVPLGTLRQIVWTRPVKEMGKRAKRKKTPLENKESRRWVHGMTAAGVALENHPHVVVVGDRESDLFPLFVAPRPTNVSLLIRVCRHNRRVEGEPKYLDKALEQSPLRGVVKITLPRSGNRAPRTAKLAVRWASLNICSPGKSKGTPVGLQFILIEEQDAPKGTKPIRWVLATTMPVETLEDAMRYVQWYAYRWRIEQFHQVFKDGCRIEELQFEEADRIRRAIATFAIVAWRVLWMTLQARETPDAPCTIILETFEWQALYAKYHKHKPIPKEPPTLREAIRMIARLGGFLGRKGDGEPGPKTIWRGLRRLDDIAGMWRFTRLRFDKELACV